MEEKYIELITQTAEKAKSNTHQIDEIKADIKDIKEENKALNKMATSVELIARDMTTFKDDVAEIKVAQSEMKDEIADVKNETLRKKANWFDSVGKFIITTIGTGILAFLLGNLFPTIFGK